MSIMGPSGAGKSTLLHILGLHGSAEEHTGFVFQSYHLLDDLTVYENIELPLAYRDVPRKERVAIVCDALDKFNIVGKRDLFPSQLSGGRNSWSASCAQRSLSRNCCSRTNRPATCTPIKPRKSWNFFLS